MEQKLRRAASELPETRLPFETIEARSSASEKRNAQRSWRPVVAFAACLVVLLCAGFGTYAYAAEVKEYNAAVQFFDEHGLSTEGLSRGQIKAVYRDITTESFTYSKTAEVIQKSLLSEQVGGYAIWQGLPTPEEIKNLWTDKNFYGKFVPYVPDIYQFQIERVLNEDGQDAKRYYMEKYEDGAVIWRTYLPFWGGDYVEVADGVIAFGYDTTYNSGKAKTDGWIAKLAQDGQLLWIDQLENGHDREFPEGVLVNADGSYTLFSRGDGQYLCVSRYTANGVRVLYKETDLGPHDIQNMANYGDGYLLQLSGDTDNEFARFVRVDQQGNVTDGFSYTDDKSCYAIQAMTEWGGKVYISAYATPKLGEEERTYGGRNEIARILAFAFAQKDPNIPSAILTPVVRANYAAVLLVCDPDNGGKLQIFYSIPGSMGADLIVTEDGRLIWETESIISTFFSIATSSFTIGGNCQIYQYAFDGSGTLIARGKTDEIVNYRR